LQSSILKHGGLPGAAESGGPRHRRWLWPFGTLALLDASVEQGAPIDGRHKAFHMEHWRIGVGVLHEARAADLNGGVPQMNP